MNIRGLTTISICLLMGIAAIWGAVKIDKYLHRNYIQLFEGDIYYKFLETYNYERCIEYNGKPNKEMIGTIADRPDLQYWVVYYDDMIVPYSFNEGYGIGHAFEAMFWTDDYSFGNKHVSVGMSRKQIEKIFKYSKKSLPPDSDAVDVWDENGSGERLHISAYFDDEYEISIGFLYDDDDRVSMIFIMDGIY